MAAECERAGSGGYSDFCDCFSCTTRKEAARPQPEPSSSTNPKDLLGMKKPPLWLNPRAALLWMAKAFEFGAYGVNALGEKIREKGYGPYNWREKKVSATVYIAAAERHLAEYLDGDNVADDSKVKHLGHAMACCAIILDAEENGNLIDDRPPKGPASKLIKFLTRK